MLCAKILSVGEKYADKAVFLKYFLVIASGEVSLFLETSLFLPERRKLKTNIRLL